MAINLDSKYEPLFEDNGCRYIVVTGSRASGKSYGVATALIDMSYEAEHVILFSRFTMSAAETSIIPEFQEKISKFGYDNYFRQVKTEIENLSTKSKILFRGIKTSSGNQTAKLKGTPGLTTFVLDEAEELTEEKDFNTIDQSIRIKEKRNRIIILMNPADVNHWVYKRFFKDAGVEPDFNGIKDGVCYIFTTYLDNLENLSDSYLELINKLKITNYADYLHFFMGVWRKNTDGALWKQSTMIDPFRVKTFPNLNKVVVALDPTVSSTGKQDGCGIVVVGKGIDNHYYVLADKSGVYTPSEWGRIAAGEYKNWFANLIVAEINQGGDLVEMNIKNVDNTIKVEKVRATRGKIVRAEPVATLYEQGLVHHVGYFPELELQQTTFTGNGVSPGNFDSLVWAIIHLSQSPQARGFVC